MAVYCKHCGARTDITKAQCPVCRADQRKRRAVCFAAPVLLLVCVLLVAFFAVLLRPAAPEPRPTGPQTDTTRAAAAAEPGTVYVTIAGTKYHREGCPHLSDTKQAIALSEALRLGYTPCADCFEQP